MTKKKHGNRPPFTALAMNWSANDAINSPNWWQIDGNYRKCGRFLASLTNARDISKVIAAMAIPRTKCFFALLTQLLPAHRFAEAINSKLISVAILARMDLIFNSSQPVWTSSESHQSQFVTTNASSPQPHAEAVSNKPEHLIKPRFFQRQIAVKPIQ